MNRIKITALYERLSHDDELQGDSNSIINQKKMLLDYAVKQNFPSPLHFTDDGFSGTRFDRPGFVSMMEAAYQGRVSAIIVKDLSRIGRDYLKVGELMEILRRSSIRLIALNDNIDTFEREDEFAPFRNIMNEWYARDASRKICSALHARGMAGKHTASCSPYGYLKNEDGSWSVDDEAAEVVRNIFRLALAGQGTYQIAQVLKRTKTEMPAAHMSRRGQGQYVNIKMKDPYNWNSTTVAAILSRREYLGHTVNFKTVKYYKDAKSHYVPEDEWVIFENTHEPIIDADTFARVQELRKNAGRSRKRSENPHPLEGRVFCADCGSKMYYLRSSEKMQDGVFVCSAYALAPAGTHCKSQHRISGEEVTRRVREALKSGAHGAGRFVRLLSKYESFEELTAPMIAEVVERVYVHERPVKWAHHSRQEVEVYVRGAGRVNDVRAD